MAENFCQNARKKNNNRQTVSFPYLSFRPISLAALTDLFQYHSDWNFFFCYTRKGNGIIRQAGAWFSNGNVQYEVAVTNEGSRCHVRAAQSAEQEGKSTGESLADFHLI